MEKIIFIVIFLSIILLLHSTPSYPGFLIKLKNDREIYAGNYQIEQDQIILYLKNGVVKFSKDDVQSISEVKGEIGEDRVEDKKDILKSEEKRKTEKDLVTRENEIKNYRDRKKETQKRLDEVKEKYFNASNQHEKDKARESMLSISRKLFELQEEVKEKNQGMIPKWWHEE